MIWIDQYSLKHNFYYVVSWLKTWILYNSRKISVMVNFMSQLHWLKGCPSTWLNIISKCLWGCFWKRWTFELVNWVKQMALPSIGGHHPICSLSAWLIRYTDLPWTFLVLRPTDMDWNLHHHSLAFKLHDRQFSGRLQSVGSQRVAKGLHSLHNPMSQFLVINLIPIDCISLESFYSVCKQ